MIGFVAAERTADLSGLWVPVITPFDERGEVDLAALDRLARRLLTDGCTGLVALGTTGECATLKRAEKDRITETCARACADLDRPLIVGIGSNCTRSTIEDAQHVAEHWGPAALLVVVPYFTLPSETAIVEHFRVIATASSIPMVVYNIPYRTGRGLGPDAILELAATPQIIGVKQCVGSLDRDTLEILRKRPPGFAVLAGDEAYAAPTIMMGGSGAIAAAAHVCTESFSKMIQAALNGDRITASKLGHALLPVVQAGFAEPNPAVWKSALHATGEISTPALRAPMTTASTPATTALLEAVRSVATSPRPAYGDGTELHHR
jgi:4-hydroxy-tetrahydrodipicolinate synthase